jgi:hypothetical protein
MKNVSAGAVLDVDHNSGCRFAAPGANFLAALPGCACTPKACSDISQA